MTAILVDLSARGGRHASFNAAFLDVMRCAFAPELTVLSSYPDHVEAVIPLLPCGFADQVRCIPFFWPKSPQLDLEKSSPTALARYVASLIINVRRLGARPRKLFLSCASASGFLAAKLIQELRLVSDTFLVLHSELNQLRGPWRSRNPVNRMLDMHSALRVVAARARLIVLEERIRSKLLDIAPHLKGCVHVLPLPILPLSRKPYASDLNGPIRIGLLGYVTLAKGPDSFLRIANSVKALCGDSVRFEIIGEVHSALCGRDYSVIDGGISTVPLSRSEYERRLANLHFVCLPYAPDFYGLAASATVFDAISFGKPVLAFATPVISDLFRELGSFGHLASSEAEMIELIGSFCRGLSRSAYEKQVLQTEFAREQRSPGRLGPVLAGIASKAA